MPGLMHDEARPLAAGWPQQLLENCATWSVPARKHVLLEGQASDVFFVVRTGMVELLRGTGDAAAVVDILEPGQWIGLEQLVQAQPSAFSAATACASTLYAVRRPVLLEQMRRMPEAGRWLCGMSALRSERIAERLAALTTRSAGDRVRWVLQVLAQRFGEPGAHGACLQVPLHQVQIARLAGTSRQFANRTLGRLREQGVITRVGNRFVVREPLLAMAS